MVEGGAVEKPGNLITADLGVGRLVGFGGNANSVLEVFLDRELTTPENLIWQWMELEVKANKVIKECSSMFKEGSERWCSKLDRDSFLKDLYDPWATVLLAQLPLR